MGRPRRGAEDSTFLLNHTSGMPDDVDYEWDKPQYDDGAAEQYVRSLVNRDLIANPGEKFVYSNLAFDLLGDVIAKVSGVSFESYIKENIHGISFFMSTGFCSVTPSPFALTPAFTPATL